MPDAERGFEGKGVLVSQAAFGTADQGGAGDGFFFREFDDGKDVQFTERVRMNGAAIRDHSKLSGKRFSPNFGLDGAYSGALPLLFFKLFGSDAITAINNSDPTQVGSTHKMVPQRSNFDEYLTLARWLQTLGLVKEHDSFVPGRIELTISAGGELQVTVSGPSRSLVSSGTVNTVSSFASVTVPAPDDLLMYSNLSVWLADRGGAAFVDGDKLTIDQMTVAFERPYKLVQDKGSDFIQRVIPNGWVATEFSMQFPLLENLDRETELLAETIKRCKIEWSGPLLTNGDAGQVHRFAIFLPSLKWESAPDAVGGPEAITHSVEANVGQADTAPNDFDEVIPYVEFDNETQPAYS